MGLKSSWVIAWRSLSRRKTKNLSAILAITLGVTLLVGIQITTDTLENSFLTSLMQTEGEVDFRISNSTSGAYLRQADQQVVADLVPGALGIMPELRMQLSALVENRYNPRMASAGIPVNYPEVFGTFYDWQTGEKMNLNALLEDKNNVLLSSRQAENLGLTKDTDLPLNLSTEFTNLTSVLADPPTVKLSDWMVDANFTSGEYVLDSSSERLYVELNPVTPFSVVTVFSINVPQLSLSDYQSVNVTAAGSNNSLITLGFSIDDEIALTLANMTDLGTLNNTQFDLTSYTEQNLRGDAFLVLMSSDGQPANLTLEEIMFEPLSPVISFVPEVVSVDLQIVGIFDSNIPGVGSQYRGVLFRLEHLQEWLSLEDAQRETDKISNFLVALKADHFIAEIEENYLKSQVQLVEDAIPATINPETGEEQKIYQVTSARLNFFSLASFFITILNTILTVLAFLVMSTGILLITNVQLMSVEDREFQTGVLRAVGENRRGIFQSMIIENLFQGIIGGILGFFGGLAFGQGVALYLAELFGTGALSVQPVITQQAIFFSVIIGIVLSVITGILPALRASKVNIVEALRGIKVVFEAKSGRNLTAIGVLMLLGGIITLLYNGIIEPSYEVFWGPKGWNTLEEWRALLVGFGLLSVGLGLVFSKFISRTKALNVTALTLYIMPSLLFVLALGNLIPEISTTPFDILIIGIIQMILGSVLFVALNLKILMGSLRKILIKIKGLKGVGQISPALISSHVTRSTLTFAIFAIILTLNVLVATLIPTSLGTIAQTEEETRGIDFIVRLNKPEAIILGTSYTQQLYQLDDRITDVIGFKTFQPRDFTKFSAIKEPFTEGFNANTDILPIGIGEFKAEQIRGEALDFSDPDWRYDFYLNSFPDSVRQFLPSNPSDAEILEFSKQAWDKFFDSQYRMAAYNVTSEFFAVIRGDIDISEMDFDTAFAGSSEDSLKDVEPLRHENGTIIENPIVFTDSPILPLGMQIWLPMNTSSTGLPLYQPFTIGGRLDGQRGGGFPLAQAVDFQTEEFDFSALIGRVYIPEHWANQTSYLAEADGQTPNSRKPNQYNIYLIKTEISFNDPNLQNIAQVIEEFTNTNNEGYRFLAKDNFYFASTHLIYSRVENTLEMTDRIASFLQIYVSFGLAIGAIGMAVISIRNVAERKREIGMMRAIGFPRKQVMLSVLLELVVLGIIGLIIGIVNGLLISIGFANLLGNPLIIPWSELGLYLSFIVLIAIGAGSVPAYIASRIPPAEALRYVG